MSTSAGEEQATIHRPTGPLADLVRHLDGPTLRHLAATAEALYRPRFSDPGAAAEALAAMAARGTRPTIGWWRRHLDTDRTTTTTEKGITQ
ncbi:MAG: hypothetical protein ACLPR9_04545 [Acidimicrobiales bacterium]|jgi:hypothetical protein